MINKRQKIVSAIPFLAGLIFVSISCNCNKNPKVIHMSYFDVLDTAYNIMDTAHLNPFKDKTLYYLVNEKEVKCLDDPFYLGYLEKDSSCQRAIGNKYHSLSVFFYKRSENTDQLIKTKLTKYLSFCNEDIIAEYAWTYGMQRDIFHYHNGKIEGSEKIIVK